ncbi:MAG: hypothetical protein GY829_12270, partial [Gammaproteobacteria bacterium]|nr:hypothetical protein [Gammaproteobacteria bacterium]
DFDITTNDETEYKGGIADDIVDGIQLNIHGRINSDGKIVAKKVRFGKSEVIKVSGEVTAVDVENQIIEILSIQFNIDNNTIFRDKSIEEDENFHLISVEVGDSLRINAFEQPDESMLAIKVTRVDDSDETCIEGIVESIESPQFVIDGVTITVSDATDIEGPDQTSIDLLAFFELLLTDVELEVKGLLNEEGILVATSIEFEDDDDDHDDHINKIAVTGVIADFESEAEFTVNGHAITTDENTEYKHGNILDLTTGILIKVKGNVDEEGLILASRILFQNTHDNSNRVELDGEIDTFDSVEDFTVNGNQVTVTDATRYVRGTIDNLILGAEVEIDARLSTDEIYIAYKIKFEDDDS